MSVHFANHRLSWAWLLLITVTCLPIACKKGESQKQDFAEQKKQAIEKAKSGVPIVAAIYLYRQKWGLWPCAGSELVPDLVRIEQTTGWHYEWKPSYWYLTSYNNFPISAVRFVHNEETIGWTITDGMDGIDLGVTQKEPKLEPIPKEKLIENYKIIFSQRFKQFPKEIIHYKGAISLLVKLGEFSAAMDIATACSENWPGHWWTNAVQAQLAMKAGEFAKGEAQMKEGVAKNPDFAHYFLLAHFYFEAGKQEDGFAALHLGAAKPMLNLDHVGKDTGENLIPGAEGLQWKAIWLCHKASKYDLTIELCDECEKYAITKPTSMHCTTHIMRAACYLAKGDVTAAEKYLKLGKDTFDAARLVSEIRALEEAIRARDKIFRYEPLDRPEPFSLFVKYE